MKRHVGNAEHIDDTRDGVRSPLYVCFDEEVRPPLQRNDLVGVTVSLRGVAGDESTPELIDAVQDENHTSFVQERVPRGQPTA
jgi:hypothetical protein